MPSEGEGLLAGRSAIITGSGRNIGRAIALAFAREGANVAVNGHHNREPLLSLAAEIEELGRKAVIVMGDVSRSSEVDRIVAEAGDAIGPIDISVSNVGLRRGRPFLDITDEAWRETIDTNLSAAFYLARATLPDMKARGWGRIINMSGMAAFAGQTPNRAPAAVAKLGLHALTRAIAREFGRAGVTANTVAPGVIDTIRDADQQSPGDPAEIARRIPLGRLGQVADVAEACVFLASERASFITGEVLHVNGGQAFF